MKICHSDFVYFRVYLYTILTHYQRYHVHTANIYQYIEDIQFVLLNMTFISPSEVENIYIS